MALSMRQLYAEFSGLAELAPAAQSGDPDAVEQAVRQGYRLVNAMIERRGWFLPQRAYSQQDLVQEGMIGFLEGLRVWRPELGPFVGFVCLCVERELKQAMTKANRRKHKLLNHSTSLDAPAYYDGGRDEERHQRWELPDPSGLGDDPAELLAALHPGSLTVQILARVNLSSLERQALKRCIIGDQTYPEAAKALGTHAKSIDNALVRAKRKLQRAVEEMGLSRERGESVA